jgi:short subunit dehydrogenase-like uncharacterized protein
VELAGITASDTSFEAPPQWMIYGANGYTGRLCANEAIRRGYRPILAGRNATAIKALAAECGCEVRVFDLADPLTVAEFLQGVSAVLHCAGPFSATSVPMLEACERVGVHYLDITGEIDVFEYVHTRDARWKTAGIAVIPGVGFDVVPTDCLASMLKRELPDADRLRLAFKSRRGKFSPGTVKTTIEGLARGGRIRENGVLVLKPTAFKVESIPFEEMPEPAVAIPWGDVSTAYYSTGIPNIEVFLAAPQKQIRQMRLAALLRPVLGLGFVQAYLKSQVDKRVQGPTPQDRETGGALLWGEVRNRSGGRAAMRMRTPEAYKFTVDSSVTAITRLLHQGAPAGALTPSMAFGPEFVLDMDGVAVGSA